MLEAVVSGIRTVDVSSLGRVGLGELAVGVEQARAALDALEARMMTAVDTLADGGSASTELVRMAVGCSLREARRRAGRAEGLARMPTVAEALDGGDITVEHADALVKAAGATSAPAVEADPDLLARVKSLPADMAVREARDWVHRRQQAEDGEARFRSQRRMRSHRMWVDDDGMFNSRSRLDPVTGAQVRAIIDDITNRLYQTDGGRDGGGDRVRTWEQRQADAFTGAVGAEPLAHRNGSRATAASVTSNPAAEVEPSPLAAQARIGCDRDRPEPSRRNQILVIAQTDVITGAAPTGRCEITGSGPIPRSELERLACEADLFGLLFDGDGLPLWHGRKLRTVSPQQWRMLLVRDQGCVLCGANPAYCHAHHIVAWSPPARGPTDITNLALVCNHHHHYIHQHGLTLARNPDGYWTARDTVRGDLPRSRLR